MVSEGREGKMSQDSDRKTELESKVTSYGNQAANDSQAQRDRAHGMRVANDEMRGKKQTPNNP
jgi:hypothetical protein